MAQVEVSQKHVHFHQAAAEDQEDQEDQDDQDDQVSQDCQDNQVSKDRRAGKDRQDRRAGKDRQHQEACRDITRTEGTGNHQTPHYKHTQRLTLNHHNHHQADPKRCLAQDSKECRNNST